VKKIAAMRKLSSDIVLINNWEEKYEIWYRDSCKNSHVLSMKYFFVGGKLK